MPLDSNSRKRRRATSSIAGMKFGRLTVVSGPHLRKPYEKEPRYWLCRCECGQLRFVSRPNLRSGATKSCGCLRREMTAAKNHRHGHAGTRAYGIWKGMVGRCHNKNGDDYDRYGGRGITVCERWRSSFLNFLADMGQPPSGKHEIDRKDNDGDYEPGNCRWATRTEQNRNSSHNVWIEADGRRMLLVDWARELGCTMTVVRQRVHKLGWSWERAVTTPIKRR